METFWDKMFYIYIMMYFFPNAILSLTFYPLFIYLWIMLSRSEFVWGSKATP